MLPRQETHSVLDAAAGKRGEGREGRWGAGGAEERGGAGRTGGARRAGGAFSFATSLVGAPLPPCAFSHHLASFCRLASELDFSTS
eukprot:scaffold62550_cov60-Phaeocystis_antarctica.AAC.2